MTEISQSITSRSTYIGRPASGRDAARIENLRDTTWAAVADRHGVRYRPFSTKIHLPYLDAHDIAAITGASSHDPEATTIGREQKVRRSQDIVDKARTHLRMSQHELFLGCHRLYSLPKDQKSTYIGVALGTHNARDNNTATHEADHIRNTFLGRESDYPQGVPYVLLGELAMSHYTLFKNEDLRLDLARPLREPRPLSLSLSALAVAQS